MSLSSRAASWSAKNWKKATFGWLALALMVAFIGQMVGVVALSGHEQSSGESSRAELLLERAGLRQHAGESVLIQSSRASIGNPRFRLVVQRAVRRLSAMPQVMQLHSPLAPGQAGQISRDRHAALIQFSLRGKAESAPERVAPVQAAVARLAAASPGFTVAELGEASTSKASKSRFSEGLASAAELSLPITLAILLLAFGSLVSASIPVVLAFSAVLAANGLAALASHLVPQAEASSSVILLMGMAVGVDYSLFYLRRAREERRRGNPAAALQAAAATSGRAVLVSGLTVVVAMAGMLLAGSRVFTSVGIGAMLVVLMAMAASLTVLPALLARLGEKIERGSLRRARRGEADAGVWARLLAPALRSPRLAAALSVGVLVVLAVPALGMRTSFVTTAETLRGTPLASTYARIQRAFPGASAPAYVVVHASDVHASDVQHAIARMEGRALASGQAREPMHTLLSRGGTVEQIEVPLLGNGQNAASMHALAVLRDRVLPATLAHVPGLSYAVTGEAEGLREFNQMTSERAPLVFAFVLGLAFLLLLVAFRSLAIPLVTIALNLLSVGAAYGVLVWIFQDGNLQGPLGFHSDGTVVAWLPLFLFPVLFGLSTDYHVFILTRIRELREGGADTAQAVADGIGGSAGVVSAAALVMAAVFAVFASLPILELKQMGVGLAVAVALDATLVRCVLLPACLKLLGERSWYLPRWLGWLGRAQQEPRGPRVPSEAAEPA